MAEVKDNPLPHSRKAALRMGESLPMIQSEWATITRRRWRARFVVAVIILAAAASCTAQVETTLAQFDGITDGAMPYSPLIADSAQNLYGTTSWNAVFDPACISGGASDCGTVFQLSPPQQAGGSWTETVLYRFTGGSDGADPNGPLAMDQAGNLYGASQYGGSKFDGTIFRLSPPAVPGDPWTETILYAFTGNDGLFPNGVSIDAAGNLFGTTFSGGICDFGTVFELSPPLSQGGAWTEQTLYTFHCNGNSSSDGADPFGGVVQGVGGSLYGTNMFLGAFSAGTVFKLDPPGPGQTTWREKVIYAFQDGADGLYPHSGLTAFRGNLYGTTEEGGTCTFANHGCGTVYELSPPPVPKDNWIKTTIYNFTGGMDGQEPVTEVSFDKQGNLYGTTLGGGNPSCRSVFKNGCGVVYRLAPPGNPGDPWTQTTLHAFLGVGDGNAPLAPVLAGRAGGLYGTTISGGDLNCSIDKSKGCGTVYKILP
ncbi:MAG: hypothetical protein LAO03_01365 [Acidobacteriia bacterium]|nr:hypothetical protein [Terriglobia bacterium]